MSTAFAQKKAALASWVTSGAEFDPKAMSDRAKAVPIVFAVALLPVKIFFRAPDAQPIREKPPPPNAHRSQLLPRCARQVVLLRMGQRQHTHAVNEVGTLPFPAAAGAAGSVDDLRTRAPRGAAPPPSTSSTSWPSTATVHGVRAARCIRVLRNGEEPGRVGLDSGHEGDSTEPSCTDFLDFLYLMSWAS